MNNYFGGNNEKNHDPIINDPKQFKAKDCSYHAVIEEVSRVNDAYFQFQKKYLNSLRYVDDLFLESQESLFEPQFPTEEVSKAKKK